MLRAMPTGCRVSSIERARGRLHCFENPEACRSGNGKRQLEEGLAA